MRLELSSDQAWVAVARGEHELALLETESSTLRTIACARLGSFALAGGYVFIADGAMLRAVPLDGAGPELAPIALGGAGRLERRAGELPEVVWTGDPVLRVVADGDALVATAIAPVGRVVDVAGGQLLSAAGHELWLRAPDGTVLHRVQLADDEVVVDARVTQARYPLLVISSVKGQHFLSVLNYHSQRLSRVLLQAPRRLRVAERRQFAFLLGEDGELVAFDLRYGCRVAALSLPVPVEDFDVDAAAGVFVIARQGEAGDAGDAPRVDVLSYRELFGESGARMLVDGREPGTLASTPARALRDRAAPPAPREPARGETGHDHGRTNGHARANENGRTNGHARANETGGANGHAGAQMGEVVFVHDGDADAEREAPKAEAPPPSLLDPFGVALDGAGPTRPAPALRSRAARRAPIAGAPPSEILATHRFALVERARALVRSAAVERGMRGPTRAELERDFRAADAHIAELRRRHLLPFDQVCDSLGLDRIDREALALAVAPYLDDTLREVIRTLRRDRARGYVDPALVLALLCGSRMEAVAAAGRVGLDWSIVKAGLVELVPPRSIPHHPSALEQELVPTERLLGVLAGEMVLGTRIADLATLHPSDADEALGVLDALERARAFELARAAYGAGGPCVVLLAGPAGVGKTRLASALAAVTGHRGVLIVDAVALPRAAPAIEQTFRALWREAMIADAALLVRGFDPGLYSDELLGVWRVVLERSSGLVLVTSPSAARLRGAATLTLEIGRPSASVRTEAWRRSLGEHGIALPDDEVHALARSYALGCARIERTVALAGALGRNHGVAAGLAALETCARTQLEGELSQYAERAAPRATLTDLVLPDDTRASIEELIHAVRARPQVMASWGFESRLERGRGICALFNGPPGVGKTFAAGVIAHELNMPLHRINVSTIVDRFVGETEKNLSRLFAEAADHHALLLFDEADSLFAKRVQARDATDRYSNMQINLLLNLIEDYEGFVILTTNMKSGIDAAFLRRIAFKVTFFAPELDERVALWRQHVPPEAPLSDDVDFAELAREYKISGGEIKNAVLRAAFRAWGQSPITQTLLHDAVQAELASAGSVVAAPTRE